MEDKVYISKVALPGCNEGDKFVRVDNNLLPPNYSRDIIFYAPEGDIYPLYEEKDLIASDFFREESESPSFDEIKYIAEKRDFAFKKFVLDAGLEKAKSEVWERFNIITKLTKHLRDTEDFLMTHALVKKIEELEKNLNRDNND